MQPTNKILTRQGRGGGEQCTPDSQIKNLDNHSELDACLYDLFISRQILSPPRLMTIPSESPCIFIQCLLVICFILYSKCRLVNVCFRNSAPHISINSDVSKEATKHVSNILCLVDRNSYRLTDGCHLNNT
jgi:hypothetical protein